jgi:hypothetical protein
MNSNDTFLWLKIGFLFGIILCLLISPLIVAIIGAAITIGHRLITSKEKVDEDAN